MGLCQKGDIVSEDKLETTHPSRLAQMLTADGADRWRAEEMGAILRHQLSVPLELDLAGTASADSAQIAIEGAQTSWPATFGDLLHHARPPLEMLQRVKRFAKACKVKADGPLPTEVATVLYFASIVVALLRCDTRISELDDKAIRTGTDWVLAQTWLDQPTRSIFEQAAAKWKREPPA
jgi:hypothetical protein